MAARELNKIFDENGKDKVRNAWRGNWIKRSNGAVTKDKNYCTSTVTEYFGVLDTVKYLHCELDVFDAIRTKHDIYDMGYMVEEAYPMKFAETSWRFIGATVNSIQKFAKRKGIRSDDHLDLNLTGKLVGYVVLVNAHILALDEHGDVCADSAPNGRGDRRRVESVHAIFEKK